MAGECYVSAREHALRLERARGIETAARADVTSALEKCSFLLGLSSAELIEIALAPGPSMRAAALREVLERLSVRESFRFGLYCPWAENRADSLPSALALLAGRFDSPATPYSDAVRERIAGILGDVEQWWETEYAVLEARRSADRVRPRRAARIRAAMQQHGEPMTVLDIMRALGDSDREAIRRVLAGGKRDFEKVGEKPGRGEGLWQLRAAGAMGPG
jgi:hypothetical protein